MIYKLTAFIFVESAIDPEEIAQEMHSGLENALQTFPAGVVIAADVDSISIATQQEISEHGLNEF